MMIFGVPVEPELQMPRALVGVTSGSGSREHVRLLSKSRVSPSSRLTRRLEHVPQTGQFPCGQIPAHGDHDRTELPTPERGKEMLRGVAQPYGQPITRTQALLGQRSRHLRRSFVQFAPTDLALCPVLRREEEGQLVRLRTGQFTQSLPV